MQVVIEMHTYHPAILKQYITKENMEFELIFNKDHILFKGHFDNFPILPGIAQLHCVIFFIKEFFDKNISILSFKKIKFSKAIFPEEAISLNIIKRKNNSFDFLFKAAENDIRSSGEIVLKEKIDDV